MSMWIGGLVLIREVMLLAKTDKWRLDVTMKLVKGGELKSFGLHNGEQAAMIIGFEKGDRI